MDRTVELDADDPQKGDQFHDQKRGKVRYNGPETVGEPSVNRQQAILGVGSAELRGAWRRYMGPSKWHLYKRGCCDKTVVFY